MPHPINYTMVEVTDDLRRMTERSAAGFRNFRRLAASDSVIWRDVFLANRDATLEILRGGGGG